MARASLAVRERLAPVVARRLAEVLPYALDARAAFAPPELFEGMTFEHWLAMSREQREVHLGNEARRQVYDAARPERTRTRGPSTTPPGMVPPARRPREDAGPPVDALGHDDHDEQVSAAIYVRPRFFVSCAGECGRMIDARGSRPCRRWCSSCARTRAAA